MGALRWASESVVASALLFLLFGSVLAVSLLWLFVVATVGTLSLTLVTGVLVAAGIAARASSAVSGDRAKQVASHLERVAPSSPARVDRLDSLYGRG